MNKVTKERINVNPNEFGDSFDAPKTSSVSRSWKNEKAKTVRSVNFFKSRKLSKIRKKKRRYAPNEVIPSSNKHDSTGDTHNHVDDSEIPKGNNDNCDTLCVVSEKDSSQSPRLSLTLNQKQASGNESDNMDKGGEECSRVDPPSPSAPMRLLRMLSWSSSKKLNEHDNSSGSNNETQQQHHSHDQEISSIPPQKSFFRLLSRSGSKLTDKDEDKDIDKEAADSRKDAHNKEEAIPKRTVPSMFSFRRLFSSKKINQDTQKPNSNADRDSKECEPTSSPVSRVDNENDTSKALSQSSRSGEVETSRGVKGKSDAKGDCGCELESNIKDKSENIVQDSSMESLPEERFGLMSLSSTDYVPRSSSSVETEAPTNSKRSRLKIFSANKAESTVATDDHEFKAILQERFDLMDQLEVLGTAEELANTLREKELAQHWDPDSLYAVAANVYDVTKAVVNTNQDAPTTNNYDLVKNSSDSALKANKFKELVTHNMKNCHDIDTSDRLSDRTVSTTKASTFRSITARLIYDDEVTADSSSMRLESY